VKYFKNVWYNLTQLFYILCLILINIIYSSIQLLAFPFYFIVAFSWKLKESNKAIEEYFNRILEIDCDNKNNLSHGRNKH